MNRIALLKQIALQSINAHRKKTGNRKYRSLPKAALPVNLTEDEKRIFRESFVEAFGKAGSPEREKAVREVCEFMGNLLQQEVKDHEGAPWLWSLGKPMRPMRAEEL